MTNKELKALSRDDHHPYGMSKWSPLFACPCFDGKGASKNTEAGTKYHALFAETLQGYLNGKDLTAQVDALEGEEDHLRKGTILACLRVIEKYIAGVPNAKAYVEKAVETWLGIYGRADLIVTAPGKLVIVDFKTFYNPGRDHSPQLAGYAIGALKTLGLGETRTGEITLATVYGDALDKDTEKHVDDAFLVEADGRISDIIDDRGAGEAKPVQCNWCDLCAHASSCEALKAVVKTVTDVPAVASIPDRWATLSSAEKAQAMVLAECVTKWADAVKASAKASAMDGEAIEDGANGIRYALVKRAGRKMPRVTAFLALARKRGIPLENVVGVFALTASNAVAVLVNSGVKKKDAQDLVAQLSDVGEESYALLRK